MAGTDKTEPINIMTKSNGMLSVISCHFSKWIISPDVNIRRGDDIVVKHQILKLYFIMMRVNHDCQNNSDSRDDD